MDKYLKGEGFQNRYRFSGTLTTCSPLHIGSGEESESLYSNDEIERMKLEIKEKKLKKIPAVSTIVRDSEGKPYIPGSSVRGVVRHWLYSVFSAIGEDFATSRDYQKLVESTNDQDEQITLMKEKYSWLELLFGTPLNEGKVEFWDANCITNVNDKRTNLLHWNPDTLTYVDTSVAIDPTTGTALENMLYRTELVPAGIKFEINIVAQNLSELEIGIILFALQAFNSKIFPITIGAGSGRGYGRIRFDPKIIYGLEAENVRRWASEVLQAYGKSSDVWTSKTGYYDLPVLEEEKQDELIGKVKNALSDLLEVRGD